MRTLGILILLVLSIEVSAQWDTTNAPKIFYNSGNVGIGVSSPNFKLSLYANENQTALGGNTQSVIRLMNNYAAAFGRRSELQFGLSQSTAETLAVIAAEYSAWGSDVGGDLVFGTSPSNSSSVLERMRINSDGFVGIGLSNPSQKLEVKGNLRIDGTSGFNHSELAFYRADGTKFATIGQGDLSVANSTFDFHHHNGNDIRFLNVGVEHLRISSSNGYIGVGIASPSGQLHVASNNNHAIKLTRANGLYGFQILRNASQGIIYFQNTDDNNAFGTRIRMEEGGANWQNLLLNPDAGNVGIGTISPSTRLHVNGALRVDGASGGVVGTGNGSRIQLSSGGATSIEENWGINIIGADDAPVKIRNSALLVGYTSASAGWGTSGNLLVQGNVGIGTTTPDAKLAVKGNIHTQEVKVDLAGAVAPDYVFEKDYDLLSLSEIETYINQHKHLPEVPSARQMEEEGLNLKEMNLILLKKVEELTLHLIDLKKENEKMKTEIQRQDQVIKSIIGRK